MVMKGVAVCFVALAVLGGFCSAQRFQNPLIPGLVPPNPQQSKQDFGKKLTWKYPEDPQPEPKSEVPFELRHPVPATTVAVQCGEKEARVAVKKDMFGTGHFISASDLKLGTCGTFSEDTAAQAFIFETELQGCGSSSVMTEDSLVYSFTLNYDPKQHINVPVVRFSKASVIVECHYPRKQNVSSLPLNPEWIPFSAVKVAEEFVYFTLRLMTDDWLYERPSYQYFLGDLINMEASVKQYYHVPLRVYVDTCVASLTPEMSSTPRYAFIGSYGCFLDARVTGSSSKFMARSADDKLQFQLEAFKFQGAESGVLYITCHLKAVSASNPVSGEFRACSYINGWKEASGADAACGSCEATKSDQGASSPGVVVPGSTWTTVGGQGRKSRDVSQKTEGVEWEGELILGPIHVGDKILH
ncbi:zona pellucida sperm-binding protein 3-like [Antennarius striatus]|uniref:zona pellucida sperm-binding protein 3-like n=1 Tax=Antennarius striatus TaxID=241820 RepID=UPI0035B3DBBB